MSSKTTTIIGIIILVVAIVIIGLVVSRKKGALDTNAPTDTTTQSAGTGAQPATNGTTTNAINADVSGTSFYELDSELEMLK